MRNLQENGLAPPEPNLTQHPSQSTFTCYKMLSSAVLAYFGWFTAVQLWTQAVSLAIIQIVDGSNWVVDALRIGLGLTGENSPKKKHIADDKWISYSYFAIAFAISFHGLVCAALSEYPAPYGYVLCRGRYLCFSPMVPLRFAGSLVLNALHCAFWRFSKMFFLFKFYDGGRGCGFNLYYAGWRKIGIDWHAFQVRQDLVTGKPLRPADQYFMNRPHVDLPDYNLHHYPWAQTQSHDEMETAKSAKAEVRAAKEEAKAAKRARREKALAERAAASTTPSPDSPASGGSSATEPASEPDSPTEAAAGLFD